MLDAIKSILHIKKKPKAELAHTDSIALELLRAHLSARAKEQVYLVGIKVWTDTPRLEGSIDDLRSIKIQARPATLSEEPLRGRYDSEHLPVVHATIDFISSETSVYSWKLRSVTVIVKNWKNPFDFLVMNYAKDLPDLNVLAERLLKHRNGNDPKPGLPGRASGPRFMNAPTS